MFILYTIFVLVLIPVEISATYDLCQGKSSIGEECDYNFDCTGFGVICNNGRCACHFDYQVKSDSDGSKYCVKLPDTIGASCSGACRYPMFCTNGQCQCVRSASQGKICLPNGQLGQSCTQNGDCTQPFTACFSGRCSCVAGTSNSGGQCAAAKRCPNGARAGNTCIRYNSNYADVENHLTPSGTSNCPDGNYCYTSDNSHVGHCCPVTCPYNTEPDDSYSCVPGQSKSCPLDTHYCHRLAGQTFSMSACCRRPCREPTPVYINGRCYARAWLGGPCTSNEQCLGGDTMQCTNGVCVCKSGFTPDSNSFTSSENPPQTCVPSCSSGTLHKSGCFSSTNLGSTCDVDEQCPSSSKCLRGRCICDCNKGYTNSGGQCVKAQATAAPEQSVTNSGGGGLLGALGGILKGGGGGGGGNGGVGSGILG